MNLPFPTMNRSETAMEILRARYLRRNDRGAVIEDVDGMFERVAHAIAAPARLFGEDIGERAFSNVCGDWSSCRTRQPLTAAAL
jgi:ribonucleotide reductase alpha subunit